MKVKFKASILSKSHKKALYTPFPVGVRHSNTDTSNQGWIFPLEFYNYPLVAHSHRRINSKMEK